MRKDGIPKLNRCMCSSRRNVEARNGGCGVDTGRLRREVLLKSHCKESIL